MEDFNFTIKGGSGRFTNLDKEYNKFLVNQLSNLDDEKVERWETYNIIMEELLNQEMVNVFEEVKYRLTDGEDPNQIMLEIINRESNSSSLLWLLKKRVEEYIKQDFHDKFY